jgi:DNA-binding response OmpR family regulator
VNPRWGVGYRRSVVRNRTLNALLLNQGRTVSTNDIAAFVWSDPDGGPDYAEDMVQMYVAQLRHRGWPIVTCRGQGYVIPWQRAA